MRWIRRCVEEVWGLMEEKISHLNPKSSLLFDAVFSLNKCTHPYTHACTHACTHTCTHIYCTYAHTCTHTYVLYMHMHTHVYTVHAHTHTCTSHIMAEVAGDLHDRDAHLGSLQCLCPAPPRLPLFALVHATPLPLLSLHLRRDGARGALGGPKWRPGQPCCPG